ncbi:MAG TPA: DUF4838 domain-containing protein [Candidatus Binataceae bacterium]|nr:DUF4838 domain-containing protein [Candidatus Binataceae bacterium]
MDFAARELAEGLGRMLSETVAVRAGDDLPGARIVLSYGATQAPPPEWSGPGYAIIPGRDSIVLCGVDERSALDAVYRLMRELGAKFPLGAPAAFPIVDRTRLAEVRPVEVQPAFKRRCLVSDIMTWHYSDSARFAMHLEHDREFIPWMARSGLNAFFYIRHAIDTQYQIPELEERFAERGIDIEYGGHVIQQLLPREHFADHPEYFPAGANGARMQMGNLCVASPGALDTVRNGALSYLGRHPQSRLLHVWGADVRKGAWCMCDRCRQVAPQLQYLELVNVIAAAAAGPDGAKKLGPAIAYLAYHDTIEPVAGLRPLANVWFEWAPRERCYSHAIDDPGCETNPRYFAALKRYVDLFEGRGHVFEYYADAILFGGLSCAMPSVIARDLRAYRALGLSSVSCLTFGAFSVFAYPINLLAFARMAINPDDSPDATVVEAAAQRHPACRSEMAAAYRAIQQASALALSYGEVLRPFMQPDAARKKRVELQAAVEQLRIAIDVADDVLSRRPDSLIESERKLWKYGLDTLAGISEYLAARADNQPEARGKAALGSIQGALQRMRDIQGDLKGTWGSFDLERFHSVWIENMRARLENPPVEYDI